MNSSSVTAGAVPTIKCEEASPSEENPAAYNLSVNVNLSAAVSNLLAAESATSTPRTPEILNSLIAMTNPLESYNYANEKCPTPGYKSGSGNDSNSSVSNGSPATSPASGTPPSIQKTCSELIKAGLKLSIESKRKFSCSDTDTSCVKRLKEESDDDYDSSHTLSAKNEGVWLTPEDEERRRRRRERNKIAATKCRLKKRERTVNLVTESEVLETQNLDLKSQLKDLEVQRRQLIDMLSVHTASCVKNSTSPTNQYNMIRPYESPTPFPVAYEAGSPYIRPESANILASSYSCVTPINGDASLDTMSPLDGNYIAPQLIESEYNRPESVLSLPVTETYTTDGYMPKTNLLVIEQNDEYYDHEMSYMSTQQCHTYPGSVPDSQAKLNNGHNDGCLV